MMVIPVVILALMAFVAGKPVVPTCDLARVNPGAYDGLAEVGGSSVYLSTRICRNLTRPHSTQEFAVSLGVVIHEAAHSRGVAAEDCAELWADAAVYWLAQKFLGVPMFTPLSWTIGRYIYDNTQTKPLSYQPTSQSCVPS